MKYIFLFLMLFFSGFVKGQQLYFIKTLFEGDLMDPPLQVYRYSEGGGLTLHKDFSKITNNVVLTRIVNYQDINTICIMLTDDDSEFYILNKNKPDTLQQLPLYCPNKYELPLHVNVADHKFIYRCHFHEAADKKDVYLYKGIDTSLTTHFNLTPEIYKNLYLTGIYFYGRYDTQVVILKPDDNKIYLPVIADTLNRPTMAVTLPQKYMCRKKTYLAILISDSKQMVIDWESFAPEKEGAPATHSLIIYNKTTQEWHDVRLKGNFPFIQAYGSWLAGRVVDTPMPRLKYIPPETSPGKEERDSLDLEYPYDEINFYYHRYAIGTLYLYNTMTKKYIEWSTHQGDSEILLVQDNKVYYRVLDKIYRGSIGEEKLTDIELLLQNREIPYIHWAFFGE